MYAWKGLSPLSGWLVLQLLLRGSALLGGSKQGPACLSIQDLRVAYPEETLALTPEQIVQLAGLPQGKTLFTDELVQAAQRLWKVGLPSQISLVPEAQGAPTLLIAPAAQLPICTGCTWEGVSPEEHTALKALKGCRKGQPLHPGRQASVQALTLAYFKEKGYLDVEVELVPEQKAQGRVQLLVQVKKGIGYQLGSLRLQAPGCDQAALRARLSTYGLLGKQALTERLRQCGTLVRQGAFAAAFTLLKSLGQAHVPFQPARIQEGVQALVLAYQQEGYLDACVTYTLDKHPGDGLIDLLIQVEKGTRYKIAKVVWPLCVLLSSAAQDKIHAHLTQGPYTPDETRAYLRAQLEACYAAQGRICEGLTLTIEAISPAGELTLRARVEERPAPRIRALQWEKVAYPVQEHLRRELLRQQGLHEGAYLTPDKLKKARRHLLQAKLVQDSLELRPLPVGAHEVDLHCKVPARALRSLSLQGYTEEFGEHAGPGLAFLADFTNLDLSQLPQGTLGWGGGQALRLCLSTPLERKGIQGRPWSLKSMFFHPYLFVRWGAQTYQLQAKGQLEVAQEVKEKEQLERKLEALFSLGYTYTQGPSLIQRGAIAGLAQHKGQPPGRLESPKEARAYHTYLASYHFKQALTGPEPLYPLGGFFYSQRLQIGHTANGWYGRLLFHQINYATGAKGLLKDITLKRERYLGAVIAQEAGELAGRFALGGPIQLHSHGAQGKAYIPFGLTGPGQVAPQKEPLPLSRGCQVVGVERLEARLPWHKTRVDPYLFAHIDLGLLGHPQAGRAHPYTQLAISLGSGLVLRTPLGLLKLRGGWALHDPQQGVWPTFGWDLSLLLETEEI